MISEHPLKILQYFDHITSKNRLLKTCKVFLGTPGTSTETEPPLPQSFKGAPHTLNHTNPSPSFSQTSPRGTQKQFSFNPVIILSVPVQSAQTTQEKISKSTQEKI